MPTKTTMPVDEIVAEVRAIREAYAARFGFDLWAIHRDALEQQRVGGRRVVSLPPRRPKASMTPKRQGDESASPVTHGVP